MKMDLHHVEIKIRLTDEDADLLAAIARREGVAKASLARMMIKRQLRRISQPTTGNYYELKARRGPMADQEISVVLDADTKARIGAIAALSGLSEEEVVRLLLEQAISDGVDSMLFGEGAE